MSERNNRFSRRQVTGMFALGATAALWTACSSPAASPTTAAKGGTQAPAPAPKGSIPMKFATATLNDVQTEWAGRMKDRLEKRTNGAIKGEVFPASQLGSIPRMIEGTQLGTIEAWMGPPDFLVGLEPRVMVPGMPLLFKDSEEAFKVISDPEIHQKFVSLTEPKGIKGVSLIFYSPMVVFTKSAAKTPEDLAGKKFRVFAAPPELETMNAWGATGVPLSLGEVGTALQQGTIDGAQSGITVGTTLKLYDFAKFVTETHHSQITSFGGVSKPWFDGLPKDIQTAIVEEGFAVQKELWDWQKGEIEKANKDWNEKTNNGLVKLTDAERQVFFNKLSGVREKVLQQVPAIKETLEMFEAKVKAVRG